GKPEGLAGDAAASAGVRPGSDRQTEADRTEYRAASARRPESGGGPSLPRDDLPGAGADQGGPPALRAVPRPSGEADGPSRSDPVGAARSDSGLSRARGFLPPHRRYHHGALPL